MSDGVRQERSVADIPDAELLRRVVRSLAEPRRGRKEFAWSEVHRAFGLGSTYSAQLCRRFGFDPDTGAELKAPSVRAKPAPAAAAQAVEDEQLPSAAVGARTSARS